MSSLAEAPSPRRTSFFRPWFVATALGLALGIALLQFEFHVYKRSGDAYRYSGGAFTEEMVEDEILDATTPTDFFIIEATSAASGEFAPAPLIQASATSVGLDSP